MKRSEDGDIMVKFRPLWDGILPDHGIALLPVIQDYGIGGCSEEDCEMPSEYLEVMLETLSDGRTVVGAFALRCVDHAGR